MKTQSVRAVPSLRKAFGERLRALHKERGLSQEALGQRAHLSGKFLGEVTRGEKSISLDSLYRVAKALGVGMTDLIPSPSKVSPEAERLYALVARKPPTVVKRVLRLVEAAVA